MGMRQSLPHIPTPERPSTSALPPLASWSLGKERSPYIISGEWYTPESRESPSMQAEVERAITALQGGQPIITGRYPDGVYREILLLEELRDSRTTPKGLLAVATRYDGGAQRSFLGFPTLTLVYFPTPRDATVYYRAASSSYRAGPGDLYPGSVGALELVRDPDTGIAQIVQLQSSVKIADPSVSKLLKTPGSSLCTRYQKWSSRLLEHAFDHVRRLGISQIAVSSLPETDLPLSAPVRNIAMICRKAQTCGFTLSQDKSVLIDISSIT